MNLVLNAAMGTGRKFTSPSKDQDQVQADAHALVTALRNVTGAGAKQIRAACAASGQPIP